MSYHTQPYLHCLMALSMCRCDYNQMLRLMAANMCLCCMHTTCLCCMHIICFTKATITCFTSTALLKMARLADSVNSPVPFGFTSLT